MSTLTSLKQRVETYLSRYETGLWKPQIEIDILHWVESRRHLPTRSEESGAMRLSRTPYVVPWLRAAVDEKIEEVVVCASAQVAKTEFGLSVLGYFTDVKRSPVFYTLADEKTARFIGRDRIRKMYESSPHLLPLIENAPVVSVDEIELNNGGYVGIAWASSVAGLATKEFRVTIADEIDKPGYSIKTSEAMPLSLIRERTESFYSYKHIFFSTPTLETGNIVVELANCDVVYDWHVPCPYCGVYQPLRFSPDHAYGFKKGRYRDANGVLRRLGRVTWPGRKDATREQVAQARYECGACKKLWTTLEKNRAVEKGKSVARGEVPKIVKKVGFHINRLYSLLGKSGDLEKVVTGFLEAVRSNNPRMIQGVINSTFAEPFLPHRRIRKTDVLKKLKDDRPRGLVPAGGKVSCLLAGIDTQDDGFYFEIRAFGYGLTRESWCIREGFLPDFNSLVRVLWEDSYKDIDGNSYMVRMAFQDAMGHRTSEVYTFCYAHRGKIWPTQGVQSMTAPYTATNVSRFPGTNKPIPGGLKLLRFDSNYFKNQLSGMLQILPHDPGAYHYHSEVTDDWLKQMTVETINDKGFWENTHSRPNHAWDCSVLSLLGHEMLGVAFWAKPEPIKKETPIAAAVGDDWIGGRGESWLNR